VPSVSKFDLTKRYCIVSFLFEQIGLNVVVVDGDVDLPQRITDNISDAQHSRECRSIFAVNRPILINKAVLIFCCLVAYRLHDL